MREIVIILVYFYNPVTFFISCAPVEIAPFDRFSCFMAQKTCFGDSYVLFGMRTKNSNNFHHFSQKARNSLFLQCKTSIGNNSGSVKDNYKKLKFETECKGQTYKTGEIILLCHKVLSLFCTVIFTSELIAKRHRLSCHYKCDYSTNALI